MKKRIMTLVLACAMVFSFGLNAFAATGETVYVILKSDLGVKSISVVNDGVQTDNPTGELPFNMSIAYYMNDKPVKMEDIAGTAGTARVVVEAMANPAAAPYYKENMALQMQFPLDTKKCTDILAPGLTGVSVGNTNTLSGMVLPGQSGKFEISFKTDSFELGSINFVCMPFDMSSASGMDVGAIGGDVKKLQNGINSYVDGVSQLKNGANSASEGMKSLVAGADGITGGYNQIVDGNKKIIEAMFEMIPPEAQAMFSPQIEGLNMAHAQYSDALYAYTAGVSQAAGGVSQLAGGLSQIASEGSTLKDGVASAIAPLSELSAPQTPTNTTPVSFLTGNEVSSIQFVMKTDAIKETVQKEDVVVEKAENKTFWQRLVALFK